MVKIETKQMELTKLSVKQAILVSKWFKSNSDKSNEKTMKKIGVAEC